MSEVRLPAPVRATLITKDEFHDRDDLAPGTIAFNGEPPVGLWTACPCGCHIHALLRFPNGSKPGWKWDGNRETPTLTPSIHHVDHWHGFLTAGFFTQA